MEKLFVNIFLKNFVFPSSATKFKQYVFIFSILRTFGSVLVLLCLFYINKFWNSVFPLRKILIIFQLFCLTFLLILNNFSLLWNFLEIFFNFPQFLIFCFYRKNWNSWNNNCFWHCIRIGNWNSIVLELRTGSNTGKLYERSKVS